MDTDLKNLQQLFLQPIRYRIPNFQRRYVWSKENQWEPLWEDVEKLAQSILDKSRPEDHFHFMGAIVLQQQRVSTGQILSRIVVDGQQRLITLQLLIAATKEVLERRGYDIFARRLERLVVNEEEFLEGNLDHQHKVWPTIRDRDAFKQAMCRELSPASQMTSNIVEAHDYFGGRAEQWLDRLPGEREGAKALEVAVRQYLQIVVIDLSDSDNPHVIFETLNARGTPLRQSDMVKNKILYDAEVELADGDGRAVETEVLERRLWPFGQDDWWDVEVGRGLQRRARIELYLNHWLTLRNRTTTKAYDEFRVFDRYASERTGQGQDIHDVAQDLGNLGDVYRDLEEGRRKDIGKFLKRRKVMNVGAITPVLLWLLSSDLSDRTIKTCLRVLESFLVRRVVCGYSARGYGKLFVELIQVMDKEGGPDCGIVSYLCKQTAAARLWPTDAEVLNRFEEAPLYRWLTRGRLVMILEGIEEELRTDKAEFQDVRGGLHIEHVMPQAWHSHYPLSDDLAGNEEVAKRNRIIHTIGNLTLVSCKLNSAMSNGPWKEKKKELAKHAVLYLNKDLAVHGPDAWNEEEIGRRAKRLHAVAVKIWPHGDECLES